MNKCVRYWNTNWYLYKRVRKGNACVGIEGYTDNTQPVPKILNTLDWYGWLNLILWYDITLRYWALGVNLDVRKGYGRKYKLCVHIGPLELGVET